MAFGPPDRPVTRRPRAQLYGREVSSVAVWQGQWRTDEEVAAIKELGWGDEIIEVPADHFVTPALGIYIPPSRILE